MLYACLATFGCLFIGLAGLIMSLVDIERFNFGLYLALLSVVGCTVSVAFWIIAPAACANPKWLQRLTERYGYKFVPLQNLFRRILGKKRKKRRRRRESKSNATNRVLVTLTRPTCDNPDRRDTDASRDTVTLPINSTTQPGRGESSSISSIDEEENDFCPLIASSIASVLAPSLTMARRVMEEEQDRSLQIAAMVPERIEEEHSSESKEDEYENVVMFENRETEETSSPLRIIPSRTFTSHLTLIDNVEMSIPRSKSAFDSFHVLLAENVDSAAIV